MTISFKENIEEQETPIMRQYKELKSKYPDAILLFRCGDFYECYNEDAVKVSNVLAITLTRKSGTRHKIAGFPFYALGTYLPKLVRAGHRIAICDQLEDQKLMKKLVKRGITEMVRPNKGFLDVDGAMCHELSREVLDALYRQLDNFIADCTKHEAQEHREAFIEIKTLLHQRMNEA